MVAVRISKIINYCHMVFPGENRWRKKGISLVPTKYGIAFPFGPMNQAGALLHVYLDGSVLLAHGGVEMGQGLHIKMIQVASRALGIPESKIYISEMSTDKVPNSSPTAGSMGSDLNGMAVIAACEEIKRRLEPVIKQNPKGSWEEWIGAAYMQQISLSTTGFYKMDNITYNFETGEGNAFNYYVFGVSCTEAEIDCLTGDHRILRTDIVMDVGDSLNPAVDIGQIEGAFVQGYGLYVLEEMMIQPNGNILSRGPGTYKLPGYGDVPIEFNVSLLTESPNPKAVYSSKAIGEPPLFLACSALFAIREAIMSARADAGVKGTFHLSAPATSEKIRLACTDHITSKFPDPKEGTFVPWFVTP